MARMDWNERPAADEYHKYYEMYTSLVPAGHLLEILARERDDMLSLLRGLSKEQAGYRYEEGKWSIKEVIGHLLDTERVFAVRSLHIARRDPAPLPSLEQDDWVAASRADERSIIHLTDEFEYVRNSNVVLFESFDRDAGLARGTASGREFSARALGFIIAGHEIHHKAVIRDRYL